MEEAVYFTCGDTRLAGRYHAGGDKGVVVTHPHPLYGGDMSNVVVEALVLAYQRKGYATLRFDFRGTGRSEGTHDNGAGEREDVLAALAFLAGKGVRRSDLAGYSFGAWVNAHIGCGDLHRMIMVSPPVNFFDFGAVGAIPCLGLVVVGDDDDFATADRVRRMAADWNPDAQCTVIPDTDHFYSGALRDLDDVLYKYI